MMLMLATTCIGAISFLAPLVLMHVVAVRPNRPSYNNRKILRWGIAFSIALSSALLFFSRDAVTTSVFGMSVYILFYSTYTDVKYRLVDRYVLRVAMVCALCLALVEHLIFPSEPRIVLSVVLTALMAGTFFIPKLGASDTRALVFISILGTALLPFGLLYVFMWAVGACIVVCGTVLAIKKRSMQVHIPLVPCIVFPLPILLAFSVL